MNEGEVESRTRRVLMFPVIRILIALAILIAISAIPQIIPSMQKSIAAGEGFEAVGAVAALVIVGRLIERRTPQGYGLGRKSAVRDLAAGFGIGAAIFVLVIGIFLAAGWYQVTSFALSKSGVAGMLLFAVAAFLVVAVSEEIVARGILLRITEEGTGSWIALVFSSALFGAAHLGNRNATVLSAIAIALEAGILLGAAFMLTRSLWLPIGIHWSWNLFEGPVFGTPVSGNDFDVLIEARVSGPEIWTGGAFGPEAGLVALTVATTTGVYLLYLAKKRGRFVRPRWRKSLS